MIKACIFDMDGTVSDTINSLSLIHISEPTRH